MAASQIVEAMRSAGGDALVARLAKSCLMVTAAERVGSWPAWRRCIWLYELPMACKRACRRRNEYAAHSRRESIFAADYLTGTPCPSCGVDVGIARNMVLHCAGAAMAAHASQRRTMHYQNSHYFLNVPQLLSAAK